MNQLNGSPILLWTGTYEQARYLARINELQPKEWCYLSEPYKLRGIQRGAVVWAWGTYVKRDDFYHMVDELTARECRVTRIGESGKINE